MKWESERKYAIISIIQSNGTCVGMTCSSCPIHYECQSVRRNNADVKELAVHLFLKEFGTKTDLVEYLL